MSRKGNGNGHGGGYAEGPRFGRGDRLHTTETPDVSHITNPDVMHEESDVSVRGVATFACLGIAFAQLIPNFDSAPAYTNAVFLPLIFISGVFYDVDEGPAFLRDIAQALPLTHLIDGLSAAIVTGAPFADHLDDLAVVLIWAAFGIVLAVRGFSWEARRG